MVGMKQLLLTPWHHGRQAAVQVPSCQGKLDKAHGRAEEAGGGCWRFLDAVLDMLLFDAEMDILLLDAEVDMLLFDAEVDLLLSGAEVDMLLSGGWTYWIYCRCDVCPSQGAWRQTSKPKPVAVGLSPVHHPSLFPSSTEWTARHAAAYQDYAGHHEAKQTEWDDDVGDETAPRIEIVVL